MGEMMLGDRRLGPFLDPRLEQVPHFGDVSGALVGPARKLSYSVKTVEKWLTTIADKLQLPSVADGAPTSTSECSRC